MRPNRRRRRRMLPNIFGTDLVKSVVVPVAGGTAGFVAARYLGNMLATRNVVTSDPKVGKTLAALVGIPATFMIARQMPGNIIARNAPVIALGMGLAASEAWLRDTPLLGGSPAAAAVLPDLAPAPPPNGGASSPEGGDGLSAYYAYPTNAEGQALSDDYYTASMLGNTADPADQSAVEGSLDSMEAVSTVTPTDMAMRAGVWPQRRRITEQFAGNGDRGHAGGMFARHLFSGMMGS